MLRLARIGVLLAAAAAGATCSAQPEAAASPPPNQPATAASQPAAYWLRVTADRVNLRTRADANSVVITRLERDAVLEAVDSQFGWHRVRPPEDVFSYVSARHVDQVSHEEGIVSVRSGMLRVRVGSLIAEVDPLQSEVQTLLPRGASVRIVGRSGNWLKIVPPAGVFAYVSGDHVERVSPAVAARLRAATTTQPSAEAAALRPSDQAAPAPDLTGPWGQRLRLIETAIEAEGRKPPLEQSWTGLVGRLRPVVAQREEPMVARLAQRWVMVLEERSAAQSALRASEVIARRAGRSRAQLDREVEQIRQARRRATSRPAFAAQGQLLRSYALATARPAERFKLQDPITREVVAYLVFPAAGPARPQPFVGQYVGVHGEREFDQALGVDVIRVVEVEALGRETPATQPARKTP